MNIYGKSLQCSFVLFVTIQLHVWNDAQAPCFSQNYLSGASSTIDVSNLMVPLAKAHLVAYVIVQWRQMCYNEAE